MKRLPQQEADEEARRRALLILVAHVDDAVELVTLVVALDLEVELAELAGPAVAHPERHRRLVAARQAAGLGPRLVPDPDDG